MNSPTGSTALLFENATLRAKLERAEKQVIHLNHELAIMRERIQFAMDNGPEGQHCFDAQPSSAGAGRDGN